MYKNLNAKSLGISGRINELIELALTHNFKGLDLDLEGLTDQIEQRGHDHLLQFLQSGQVQVGGFDISVDCQCDEAQFQVELDRIDALGQLGAVLGAIGCTAVIPPYCDGRPYHEQFELCQRRYADVAGRLQPHGIRLGLTFRAAAAERAGHEVAFITTTEAYLALLKTATHSNIGVTLDLWNWHLGGGTVEQLRTELPIGKLVAVRLADLPVGATADNARPEQRLIPGSTGVVPAVETVAWLQEGTYEGPLTPYCHPSVFQAIRRNKNKIVKLIAEAIDALLEGESLAMREEAKTASAEPTSTDAAGDSAASNVKA